MNARSSQRGVSLVELMIAVAIGLFLLAAISFAYLSSRQAFRSQDAGARNQENLRYAFEVLSSSTRMAGYLGCANLRSITPNIIANAPVPAFQFDQALRVYDNGSGWTNPTTTTRVAGTDVVVINRGSQNNIHLTGNMTAINANIQINGNPYGFVANQILIITDCAAADIFRASNVSSGSGTITIAHANNVNTAVNLSKPYKDDAEVMALEQETYFIGINSNGNPALFRIGLNSTTPDELVEHVYDMQVTLGVDSSGDDGSADQYLAPASVTNWGQVVSVRYELWVRSPEDSNTVASRTYTYNGASVTDRRLSSSLATVVGVRNRLP
jgi:type IV pilus assembly protein PilW